MTGKIRQYNARPLERKTWWSIGYYDRTHCRNDRRRVSSVGRAQCGAAIRVVFCCPIPKQLRTRCIREMVHVCVHFRVSERLRPNSYFTQKTYELFAYVDL